MLYLKSGEILKGRLQSYEREKSITFVLISGDTVRGEGETLNLIKGLRMGRKNRPGYVQKTEGFWNAYEFGANFEGEGGATFFPQGAVQATWGYQWSKMKKLGLGLGIEAMEDFNVVPIYVNLRGDWFEGKVTPYHFVNIGYGLVSPRSYANDNERFGEVNGGFRFNPGLGIKIHRPKTFITLSAGYLLQNASYQQNWWGGRWDDSAGISETSRSFRRMSFRFGIGF
ncbi:MAG: hypothetical protein RIF33_24945 [Cyclobacteriaceae bacterium]